MRSARDFCVGGDAGRFKAEGDCAAVLAACSACAGDYEDPDRTAWPTFEEEPEEADSHRDRAHGEASEEFPAEE